MPSNKSKKVAIIGKKGTITVFRLFGFTILEIETEDDVVQALQTVEEEKEKLGMLLVTSDIQFSEKQLKRVTGLDIPMITVPVHSDQTDIAYNTMEQMIEKAVGMKLNFLKNN